VFYVPANTAIITTVILMVYHNGLGMSHVKILAHIVGVGVEFNRHNLGKKKFLE